MVKLMLADNARDWHNELDSTLWAYRTSKRSSMGTTPYALMYGHDVVLPLEINVCSLRVQEQHQLLGEEYVQAMWQEHEDLDSNRLASLDSLVVEKKRVSRAYDKQTRGLSFKEGDLVWKVILPLGEKSRESGKWSPRWGGPYIVDRILRKGAYQLRFSFVTSSMAVISRSIIQV
jgi:hypothetical protein